MQRDTVEQISIVAISLSLFSVQRGSGFEDWNSRRFIYLIDREV